MVGVETVRVFVEVNTDDDDVTIDCTERSTRGVWDVEVRRFRERKSAVFACAHREVDRILYEGLRAIHDPPVVEEHRPCGGGCVYTCRASCRERLPQ